MSSLNSFKFLIFFLFFYFILLLLQIGCSGETGKRRQSDFICRQLQLILLLFFSYVLIFNTNIRFGICIVTETIIAYIIGRLLEITNYRKIMNIAGITILLLMLGFFKYCEFFVNSIRSIGGLDAVTLNIILPMGISFYTFTAISYLIDVYHRKYEAEKNILNFSLFIAFFPKLEYPFPNCLI